MKVSSAARRHADQGSARRFLPSTPPKTRDDELLTITFAVRRGDAPALRSAVDEMRTMVGGRLEGPSRFAREHALTRAVIALGALGAAVNAVVPKGDPDYAR